MFQLMDQMPTTSLHMSGTLRIIFASVVNNPLGFDCSEPVFHGIRRANVEMDQSLYNAGSAISLGPLFCGHSQIDGSTSLLLSSLHFGGIHQYCFSGNLFGKTNRACFFGNLLPHTFARDGARGQLFHNPSRIGKGNTDPQHDRFVNKLIKEAPAGGKSQGLVKGAKRPLTAFAPNLTDT